jgi:hypothetical protein
LDAIYLDRSTVVWEESAIDADPLYRNPGYWDDNGTPDDNTDDFWVTGDHQLRPGSPCIDAGDNDVVPAGVTTDLAGDPRFVDDVDTLDSGNGVPPIVDMGAYEFVPGEMLRFRLDIMPGKCPNRFNPQSDKQVRVAILGQDDFDVGAIDAESLTLTRADGVGGSVRPSGRGSKFGITIRDVATPFDGDLCACHRQRADGIDDLVLNFSTRETAEELELQRMKRGDYVRLTLRGMLLNGMPFAASDCVLVVGRR